MKGFFNVGLSVRAWPEYRATFEMSFNIVCKKPTPKLDVKAGPTGWHQELAYFVGCIRKGVKPTKYQTVDSIADTMKIVFAEAKSVASRKPVRL